MNKQYIQKIIWIKFRIVMSIIFLWAFFDKTFGLGFSTKPEGAWINGGSPTSGYLLNATRGPFAEFFQSLAGIPLVDWLFMLGLLGVGGALLINKFIWIAAISGSVMMFLMWFASFPPTVNPLFDYHVVYIFALLVVALHSKPISKNKLK
jgi:thiosulfate dehydrogenase [quinone] large subunit